MENQAPAHRLETGFLPKDVTLLGFQRCTSTLLNVSRMYIAPSSLKQKATGAALVSLLIPNRYLLVSTNNTPTYTIPTPSTIFLEKVPPNHASTQNLCQIHKTPATAAQRLLVQLSSRDSYFWHNINMCDDSYNLIFMYHTIIESIDRALHLWFEVPLFS